MQKLHLSQYILTVIVVCPGSLMFLLCYGLYGQWPVKAFSSLVSICLPHRLCWLWPVLTVIKVKIPNSEFQFTMLQGLCWQWPVLAVTGYDTDCAGYGCGCSRHFFVWQQLTCLTDFASLLASWLVLTLQMFLQDVFKSDCIWDLKITNFHRCIWMARVHMRFVIFPLHPGKNPYEIQPILCPCWPILEF